MYSQCPDCLTRFRVTADALRAARGTVRCGRCGSAFDALARLSDTLPEPEAEAHAGEVTNLLLREPGAAAPTPREQAGQADYHFSVDDIEKVFVDERDWQRQFGAAAVPSSTEPVAPGGPPLVLVEEPEAVEDITLEGERVEFEGLDDIEALQEAFEREAEQFAVTEPPAAPSPVHDLDSTDRFEVLSSVPELVYPADEEPAPEPAAFEPEPAPPRPKPEPLAIAAWRRSGAAAEPVSIPVEARHSEIEDHGEDERRPARGAAIAWTFGCLLLALALAAQITHHFRQDLVRDPRIGPVLRDVYERLGLPLSPNWDPAAFELRQWGASDDSAQAPGRMSVRASLQNRAAFAQPFPLLRLQLEDRFGNAVATRDFEPREYLKDPALATRMFAPDATVEARIDIVDPGSDAVGYRLDVCLRETKTLLRCAQGPG